MYVHVGGGKGSLMILCAQQRTYCSVGDNKERDLSSGLNWHGDPLVEQVTEMCYKKERGVRDMSISCMMYYCTTTV